MKTNKMISNRLLLFAFIFSQIIIRAQLKVQSSNGHVGIGTLSPVSMLNVVGDAAVFSSSTGYPTSAAFIRCNNNFSGPTTPEYTWFGEDQTGIYHPAAYKIAFSIIGTKYVEINNGFYPLTVSGNGLATAWWTTSDKRFKKNIVKIDGALDKVLKLNGVHYEYNTSEFRSYNFDSTSTLGFIAQELKEVVPEVVKMDNKGYYGVNYTAIIPLLVEAFKEQNKKIEGLQQQIQTLGNTNNNSSGVNNFNSQSIANINSSGSNVGSGAILYQNAPNPFNNETTIKYYLPATVKVANLYIYDRDGNKKKSITIDGKGDGNVKIAANELGQGIYFYSLILDGIIFDSKTMLITQ